MDHNKGSWVGRLTRAPEYFPPGTRGDAHCTFTLAINRVVSSQNGPETDYISYSLWGEEAQRFVDKRDKGDEVGVVGRLRSSQIQLPGGGSRTVVEVRVVEVHYGRRSLKNMAPAPKSTSASRAIGQLQREFTT